MTADRGQRTAMKTETLHQRLHQGRCEARPLRPDLRRDGFSRSEDGRAVSEEEYWEKWYGHPDFCYEWRNGILEEKPVSEYETILALQWMMTLLKAYLETYPIADVANQEFGFRLNIPGVTDIRRPDLGVATADNPVRIRRRDRSYSGIFDLCVEAISDTTPEDITRDTVDKKREYEAAGVREYFILDAKGRHQAFYRMGKRGKYVRITQGREKVIRSEVLPGFRFRISDLDAVPLPKEMSGDNLYSDFVLPYYQEEMRRAEKAEKLAATEKRRAEKAEKQVATEKRKIEKLVTAEKRRAEKERRRAEKAEKLAATEKRKTEKAEKLAREAEEQIRELRAKLRASGIPAEQ